MMNQPSRWTTPLLRVGMGLFLALWGVDKLVAAEGATRIFSAFYGIDLGRIALGLFGVAEIILGVALALGVFRFVTAWAQLLVNGVSTLSSWKQILDPWGLFGLTDGGTHLFLASVALTAMSIALVLNWRDPAGSLDLSRPTTP